MAMLDPDNLPTMWPYCAVPILEIALQTIGPHTDPLAPRAEQDGIRIRLRRLRPDDQTQTIGIHPTLWRPDENTIEMGRGFIGRESTISRYPISITTIVKDMDWERGAAVASTLSTLVRQTLSRSEVLKLHLPQLAPVVGGVRESFYKCGVSSQEYMDDMDGNTYVFLSATEFWVETQIN